MSEPDKFQTEGERLSEQFQKLRENRMVLDWWQKQLTEVKYAYQGVSHVLNMSMADLEKTRKKLLKENRELKDRCEQQEKDLREAFAAIGELQERVDRMAEWMNKQRGIEK